METCAKEKPVILPTELNDVVSVLFYFMEDNICKVFVSENAGRILFPIKQNPVHLTKTKGKVFEDKGKRKLTNSDDMHCYDVDICWSDAVEELLYDTVGIDQMEYDAKLIQLLRIYNSLEKKFYYHAVFCIKLSREHSTMVEILNKLVKYKLCDLKSLLPSKFERNCIYNVIQKFNICCDESIGITIDETSTANLFNTKGPECSYSDTLLKSSGYSKEDIDMLYEEFIKRSYPYNTVRINHIFDFLSNIGWKMKEKDAFRGLDIGKNGELNAQQFVLGLIAMDPLTPHGGTSAEVRCRHIFRMYDKDEDNHLSKEELSDMVSDIAQMQGFSVSQKFISSRLNSAFQIFGISPSNKIPLNNFLVSVGNLRFRGTSLLFRTTNSIPSFLRYKFTSSLFSCPLKKKAKLFHFQESNENKDETNKITSSDSPMCQDEVFSGGYILAEHTVMIRRSGTVTHVNKLLDMERAGEVDDTGLEVYESTSSEHHSLSSKFKVCKQFSSQAFNNKSLPNEVLTALRYFEYSSQNKPAMDWGTVDKIRLAKYIHALCMSVGDLFEAEPRFLQLPSPCYVLGDLHGNYHDLMCFEKALWRLGPHLTPASFLFLGDYVDRGEYGVEVIAYLFAQKLKAPKNFHLLRGNHELRDIQKAFTFYNECIAKFGEINGRQVWEDINKAFDRMPIVAVVDTKIFCIHGGIPLLNGDLSELENIPCPLSQPEEESPLAWQMMWNDPVSSEDNNLETEIQLESNNGFAFNVKRQTAYIFDENAFNKFLKNHKLTHVIRAHEVKQAGFEIQQGGRLFTVFSSSHYCGGNNEAACILIHDMRIRIIRIDTT